MESKELYAVFVSRYKHSLSKHKELRLKLEEVETELKGIKSPRFDNPSRIVSHINKTPYALYDKKEQLLTRISYLGAYISAFENALFTISDKVYLPYLLLYSFKQMTICELANEIGVSRISLVQNFNEMIDEFILKNETILTRHYNDVIHKV